MASREDVGMETVTAGGSSGVARDREGDAGFSIFPLGLLYSHSLEEFYGNLKLILRPRISVD